MKIKEISMSKEFYTFFYQNPIFTLKEFREALSYKGSSHSLSSLLKYHVNQKHLLKIKNGLYAYIPPSSEKYSIMVDPYLLGSKLTEDSILAYQSALGFWGHLHSMRNDIVYLTKRKLTKSFFEFQGIQYKGVSFPVELILKNHQDYQVEIKEIQGIKIRVTSLERTFVDILDRPYFGNDWEQIYKSFASIPYLELENVVEYALLLGKSITIAKVGLFLDFFKEAWYVKESHFKNLEKYIPKQALCIDKRSKENKKLISKWNIIVPESLITKSWEEPHEDI